MKALIILIIVVGLWFVSSQQWFVSSQRWRRRVLKPAFPIALVYFLISFPLTASWLVDIAIGTLVLPVPADTRETTDMIIVLGRGEFQRNERVKTSKELWEAKRAPSIFVSGMSDVQPMIEKFEEQGIPRSLLSGENCSQTTEENALFTSAVLNSQDIHKILLVTDPPHMLRSLLLFRRVGFDVIPHLSPLPSKWNYKARRLIVAREYLGLLEHFLTGRFNSGNTSDLQHPLKEIIEKISDQKCQF